ncbi:hypothetical protein [Protaetiibacter mangrovi]|uniref:Uncharacterized protein n=1 Tax=Protaetiibacter mangrovi TaxID=2970926 RepID=A0ABT1ZCV5_9MICO|nr:hypothetical protein [Protaetiibacter mangrovi]MCS0498520.1 hypothetical protein [Protaetiibacter mangrovi]
MRTTTASVPLLVVLALALVGCGPAAPSGSPTSPPASAEPSAAPVDDEADAPEPAVDPLTTVTRIMVRSDILYFGDTAGWALDGFRYTDDPTQVVAMLTTVFGAAPSLSTEPGSLESNPAELYDWGGFVLGVPQITGERGLYDLLFVRASSPSIHGVTVETADGIRVGSAMDDARAHAVATMDWGMAIEAELDPTPVDPSLVGAGAGPDDDELFLYVAALDLEGGAAVVDEISAPRRNFGS